MIGFGKVKAQKKEERPQVVEQGDSRILVSTTKARREGSALRIVGNLLIVAGLLMLLSIGGWWGFNEWNNAQFRAQLVEQFGQDAIKDSPDDVAIAITPTATLEPLPTPLPTATALPDLTSSNSAPVLTNIIKQKDTSPAVRLHIPSVKIDQPIVEVGWSMIPAGNGEMKSEWNVADYAVGHHKGSAYPGEVGNVVLSGHVDYKGEVFRDLHKAKKGDEVVVYTEKGQYIYVVHDIVLVREEGVSDAEKRRNARYMNPTPDLTLTMITCWPYGIDTHRLIVIAKPYQSAISTQSEFTLR